MGDRFRIGRLSADVVGMHDAVDRIDALVAAGSGGSIFTPNVDHVVNAERKPAFAAAYARASLCLADGMPLVWVSRLLGPALPERVAGSDLAGPLIERAAARGWRVGLFGGSGDAATVTAGVLAARGVNVVAVDAPRVSPDGVAPSDAMERLRIAAPQLLLVGLGSPKQELFIDRAREQLPVTVAFACGAVIDFLAGRIPRAPGWMARTGLEWLYRLGREPRRLWRRYLVNDPVFIGIVARDCIRHARSRR
jgi:N-acetylglucosaminyldiphosphoundecaprenol N-acetyl-beta-D-mannosaminyltransferase